MEEQEGSMLITQARLAIKKSEREAREREEEFRKMDEKIRDLSGKKEDLASQREEMFLELQDQLDAKEEHLLACRESALRAKEVSRKVWDVEKKLRALLAKPVKTSFQLMGEARVEQREDMRALRHKFDHLTLSLHTASQRSKDQICVMKGAAERELQIQAAIEHRDQEKIEKWKGAIEKMKEASRDNKTTLEQMLAYKDITRKEIDEEVKEELRKEEEEVAHLELQTEEHKTINSTLNDDYFELEKETVTERSVVECVKKEMGEGEARHKRDMDHIRARMELLHSIKEEKTRLWDQEKEKTEKLGRTGEEWDKNLTDQDAEIESLKKRKEELRVKMLMEEGEMRKETERREKMVGEMEMVEGERRETLAVHQAAEREQATLGASLLEVKEQQRKEEDTIRSHTDNINRMALEIEKEEERSIGFLVQEMALRTGIGADERGMEELCLQEEEITRRRRGIRARRDTVAATMEKVVRAREEVGRKTEELRKKVDEKTAETEREMAGVEGEVGALQRGLDSIQGDMDERRKDRELLEETQTRQLESLQKERTEVIGALQDEMRQLRQEIHDEGIKKLAVGGVEVPDPESKEKELAGLEQQEEDLKREIAELMKRQVEALQESTARKKREAAQKRKEKREEVKRQKEAAKKLAEEARKTPSQPRKIRGGSPFSDESTPPREILEPPKTPMGPPRAPSTRSQRRREEEEVLPPPRDSNLGVLVVGEEIQVLSPTPPPPRHHGASGSQRRGEGEDMTRSLTPVSVGVAVTPVMTQRRVEKELGRGETVGETAPRMEHSQRIIGTGVEVRMKIPREERGEGSEEGERDEGNDTRDTYDLAGLMDHHHHSPLPSPPSTTTHTTCHERTPIYKTSGGVRGPIWRGLTGSSRDASGESQSQAKRARVEESVRQAIFSTPSSSSTTHASPIPVRPQPVWNHPQNRTPQDQIYRLDTSVAVPAAPTGARGKKSFFVTGTPKERGVEHPDVNRSVAWRLPPAPHRPPQTQGQGGTVGIRSFGTHGILSKSKQRTPSSERKTGWERERGASMSRERPTSSSSAEKHVRFTGHIKNKPKEKEVSVTPRSEAEDGWLYNVGLSDRSGSDRDPDFGFFGKK